MMRLRATLGVAFLVGLVGPLHAATPGPPGASDCMSCHPATARADTPVPALGGVDPAVIVTAMREFREGKRPATVMDRIAKGFSDDDVAAIAAFLARPQ